MTKISKIIKSENLKPFLLYVILVCAIYAQVVFWEKSLLPNLYYPQGLTPVGYQGRRPINTFNIDLATPAFYEMPINKLVGDMYLNGHIPLWNPYQGCGTPLSAQYSTKVFFPYQILEDISPYWLWDYLMLTRLIIAAFFTYLFLRLLGLSLPCAFLGGIFYSLCGSFTWFINLEQFVNVAMMLPVCLFSLERLVQYKKGRYIAECAVVFALMLLAGQPEIAIYLMLLMAIYYLFRVITEKPKILAFLKSTLKFGGLTLLALGLCTFLILPFLELIPNSYQCHPLGGTMGVQDPARLWVAIGMLIPSFFELPTHYRLFPHNGAWDWLGGYTGILVPFLIMLGFFSKSKYRKYLLFFSLFGFFIILKNFGFPLVAWIGELPLLDQSWSPRWAGPVWTFSLACAAAIGLEMASQVAYKKKVIFGVLSFLLILIGFLSYKTAYFPQFKTLNTDQLKSALPPILGGIAISICVLLIAAFLFLYCRNKKGLIYSIMSLAILELWFYIPKGMGFPWTVLKFIPFLLGISVVYLLANEKWRLGIAGIILISLSFTFIDVKSPFGFPDRHNIFKEPDYVNFLRKDKTYSRLVAGDGILMPNFSSSFGIYDIRYINSLSTSHYQNYVDNHLMKTPHAWITDRLWFTGIPDLHKVKTRSIYQEINDNLLYYSYLGVKYILVPKDITLDIPLVYDTDIKIYENPYAFPRVYIAHKVKMVSNFQKAQEFMKSQDVDIRDTVILEEPPPAWYNPSSSTTNNSNAWIEEYTPNRIKIRAKMKSDGILVLTDISYPGWKVYIDKKEGKIYRINGLVRGLFLRKGEHDIIFKYQPLSFKLGLIISFASILLCVALMYRRVSEN